MANKQAEKRRRQDIKKRSRNGSMLSRMRTHLKRVLAQILHKNTEQANHELSLLSSILDKSVKKGLIHINKANRYKSRLCLKIKALLKI